MVLVEMHRASASLPKGAADRSHSMVQLQKASEIPSLSHLHIRQA
jgi:hypothetical protein